jgi:hypothetical protein
MSQAFSDTAAVADNLMEESSGLPDYVEHSFPCGAQEHVSRFDLWQWQIDDLWEMYGQCEGLASRVEVIAALIEFAVTHAKPMMDEEQITREMLWARILFEAEWLASQPLLVFSRARINEVIAMWKKVFAA